MAPAAPRVLQKMTWFCEYWRGSLYVHCHSGVLMALRCSDRIYDMVQLPGDSPPYDEEKGKDYTWSLPKRSVLASYERGVHYVTIQKFHLLVWALKESTISQLEWTLAHEAVLKPYEYMLISLNFEMEWAVVESKDELISLLEYSSIDESSAMDEEDAIEEDVKDDEFEEVERIHGHENSASLTNVDESVTDDLGPEDQKEEEQEDDKGEEFESGDGSEYSWNSDEFIFIDLDETVVNDPSFVGWRWRIVGFHPHKDVLNYENMVLAYHLGTSRMQYLVIHQIASYALASKCACDPAVGMDAVDDANCICFPYNVLVDILRRALAESRCVCRWWRAIVDAHNLLFPHVFPREFPGVYTNLLRIQLPLRLLCTADIAPRLPMSVRPGRLVPLCTAALQRPPPHPGQV
ncbi:hypothetical protein ACQ4PT_061452 [Festuca glaucescens]